MPHLWRGSTSWSHGCAGVDRLTFSVIWDLDEQGQVLRHWAGRSVIRTTAKLAYHHAQAMIEGSFDPQHDAPTLFGSASWSEVRLSAPQSPIFLIKPWGVIFPLLSRGFPPPFLLLTAIESLGALAWAGSVPIGASLSELNGPPSPSLPPSLSFARHPPLSFSFMRTRLCKRACMS